MNIPHRVCSSINNGVMKKLLLLVFLCISSIAYAISYSGTCGAMLQWSLDTSTGDLIISGSGNMDTYSESNHAPWYNNRQYILRVLMSDSVTSIGDYAFDQCSALTYAYIPVELSSGGRLAMRGCTSLKEVYWNARNLISYYGPLNQADSLEKLVFGDSVRVIGHAVVPANSNLRRVEFGPNITNIDDLAFSFCNKIDTVVWNVRRYTMSFRYGSRSPLRCMIIGDSVRYIGNGTCASNAHIVRIPYNVDTLDVMAFGFLGGQFDTIIWAARAPHIIRTFNAGNRHLFDGQQGQIRAFRFEEGVERIPESLCQDMTQVSEIHLPSTVDSIENWAFSGMSGLKRLNIPYHLRNANYEQFFNTNSIEHIRWEAEDCRVYGQGDNSHNIFSSSIRTWTFGDSVRVIPGRLCINEAITHLHIPASVDSIGPDAFLRCDSLQTIEVDTANAHFDSRDGCNAIISTANDSLIRGATFSRIPASVRHIAPEAFRGLNHLVWAELHHPDVTIGEHAFADIQQLDSILWNVRNVEMTPFYKYDSFLGMLNSINPHVQFCTFGDSVEHIPAGFCKQMQLEELYFPYALQTVGKEAMLSCIAPRVVWNAAHWNIAGFTSSPLYAMRESVQELVISDSVRMVPHLLMYSDCPLSVLRLSASVDSIGNQAFKGCTALQDIYCAAVNPPGGSLPFPKSIYNTTIVHVPCGSLEKYSAHPIWSRFSTIVEEEMDGQPCTASGVLTQENAGASASAVKVFRNGQLLILRDGAAYTIQGQRVF